MESKLDEQMYSRSDYRAHLWVVQNFDTKSLKYFVIDNFGLHNFQFNIGFVFFGIFLPFSPSSFVTVLHTSG